MCKWIEEANRRTAEFNHNNVNPAKYSSEGTRYNLDRRNYETFRKNNDPRVLGVYKYGGR